MERWVTPFNKIGAVFIRKGGGMFKVRNKYMFPRVVYNNKTI